MRPRSAFLASVLFVVLSAATGAAQAVGQLADVSVIDRSTGQALPVYRHQGRLWVQGTPGARYAVRVFNRGEGRVMAVLAVDGVNAVSGQTAAFDQAGYVFAPGERYDVAGWRKSNAQIAAFYFTNLPDSYAARTGRPNDVGVIGVALFRERAPAVTLAPAAPPVWNRRDDGAARERTEPPAAEASGAGKAAAGAADSNSAESRRAPATAPQPAPSLGTGHGEREVSRVETTTFERASARPDETIAIHYDSRDNLVAMGVIREPRPFPAEPQVGFVPDPPRGW